MKPGILIVGASGLLGSTWVRLAKSFFRVSGTLHIQELRYQHSQYISVNLGDIESIKSAVRATDAQIVVNCVAMTDVDACQLNPELAFFSNVTVAKNLASVCSFLKRKLIHVSTDHIFSGLKPMSRETDQPQPLNVYAETKLLGEQSVLATCPSALILRTNFFGWGTPYKKSFSDTILDALRSNRTIELFADAFFTPILMQTLITSAHKLLDREKSGVYHLVSDDRVSKYQFGVELSKVFDLDQRLIKIAWLKNRIDLAPRPLDLSLSNLKLHSLLSRESFSLSSQLLLLKQSENSDY